MNMYLEKGKINIMGTLHLTAENFSETISNGSVLVDFWADWCGPCRTVGPIIDKLAEEYEGRVTVAKVDVENEKKLAIRFKVMSIPTVVLFKDGIETKRFVGVQPKDTYKAELDKASA